MQEQQQEREERRHRGQRKRTEIPEPRHLARVEEAEAVGARLDDAPAGRGDRGAEEQHTGRDQRLRGIGRIVQPLHGVLDYFAKVLDLRGPAMYGLSGGRFQNLQRQFTPGGRFGSHVGSRLRSRFGHVDLIGKETEP